MTRTLLALLLIAITSKSFSQDASVEKSINGIQTGLIGVWAFNEHRLAKKISLRSEVGLELGVVTSGPVDDKKLNFVGATVISLEPRWYYNLNKREAKGHNISKNSGNIFSIRTILIPEALKINPHDDIVMVNQLAFVPKWGIRRVYGSHFTFEVGFGVGPQFYWGKEAKNMTDKQDVFVDATVRFGYTF